MGDRKMISQCTFTNCHKAEKNMHVLCKDTYQNFNPLHFSVKAERNPKSEL